MVGPIEESHGYSPLESFKYRPWMTLVLSNLSCYHISETMESMIHIPSLSSPLMRGPRYVAKGAM